MAAQAIQPYKAMPAAVETTEAALVPAGEAPRQEALVA